MEATDSAKLQALSAGSQSNFASADDVLAALASIPGIDNDLPQRQAAREQMERAHRTGIVAVRQVAALTQVEVAHKMGIAQGAVSRLESRPNMMLSTMKAYFDALGATADIVVRIGGTEQRLALSDLVEG